MKNAIALAFFLLCVPFAYAHAYTSKDLKTANKYYDQQSYQLAATEFAKFLDQETKTPELAREVSFKWADSIVKGKDERNREKAEKRLLDIINDKDEDRWWAESQIALSEHYIGRDPYGKRQDIKKWLDDARDWWAGSSDIDLARTKFISTSFMLADFMTERWGWYNADIRPIRLGVEKSIAPVPKPQGNQSLRILFEEILKVAKSDEDKAHAEYGLAMTGLQNYSGDQKLRDQAIEKFELITSKYQKTEWADDAYYQLGMYFEQQAKYVEAVKTYRDLLTQFRAGESKWVNDAKRRIEYITSPSLNMNVSHTFIPGSEIQFNVNWRNVKQAQFTLYQLDMTKELGLYDNNSGHSNYRDLIRKLVENSNRYRDLPVYQSWNAELEDEGKHIPRSQYKGLAHWRGDKDDKKEDPELGKLPVGAYLLMITAGGKQAYDLILISDVALVSKVSKDRALLLAMDAKTGKPIQDARVKYVYTYQDAKGYTKWDEGVGVSDKNGLVIAALKNPRQRNNYYQNHNLFATMKTKDNKQAFVQSNYYTYNNNNKGQWWLYAFADRPAYRPNETVSFKGILRSPKQGEFINPAGKQVKAIIQDAQGKQVKEGIYTLNDYGAFSDTLVLDDKAVLGQYNMLLYAVEGNHYLSTTPLFRLEEYKLPEFIVNVKPKPKEDETAAGTYRLGDKLEIEIDSQYYFGGAVAEAEVEYLVYQQAYYHQYSPVKRYPWYYENMYARNYSYGHGQLIKQDKTKTDKDGKAYIEIETPKDSGTDLKYHIEVRVVDKSRREIKGTSDIKVTKNAFFAYLEPAQHLYRPGDKTKVEIKTMTANEAPVAVEGKITVMRNWWREPVIQDGKPTKHGGYGQNELFTKFVKTNERGEATFEFEPTENGYYTVMFTGFDKGNEVVGQTHVYVSDNQATNIGYRYSGLQIITEKDTYAAGETARAMIVSDVPDTWVLFTKESDELYDYEMLYLEGSVKIVEFPVKGNYTPNIFLNALSGSNFQLKRHALQIIVPPDNKFLNVTITSDKEVYQPQEEGTFEVQLTDKDGNPVQAELALGLTDASVYYIQSEYAQDIRQFYYGDKKRQSIQTQASFYQRPYAKFVRGENGEVITEAEFQRRKRQQNQSPDTKNDHDDNGAMDSIRSNGARLEGESFGGGMAANRSLASAPAVSMEMDVMEESVAFADSNLKAKESKKREIGKDGGKGSAAGSGQEEKERVRDDFRSTVIWQPSIVTDESGKAVVKVKFPDSLTTWRMTARALTKHTAIGTVTHDVKSNKDLMIRLQAPRFFTERDLTAVSALIDNLSDKDVTVSPIIKAEGLVVSGLYQDGQFVKGEMGPVVVPAKGQVRVGWGISAQKAGQAKITVRAKSKNLSDAMQKTYPVIPHGIEKFIAQSLVMKGGEGSSQVEELTINIPKERIKESTSLRINISPSMAANLLDALPYLADYPYGCVEQTMSRFLPATIVRKTMGDLGISNRDIATYMSDVFEPRNDPKGHPQRREDATYMKLDKMVGDGLNRLYDFQHSDGGWGWWKHGDSDRFMSAYVVWGMSLARKAGIDVKRDVIARGVKYLQVQLVEEEDRPDMLAWMLHALAEAGSSSKFEDKQRERLWTMRNKLNPYTRALFALSEHNRGQVERSKILGQNVINGVIEDEDNGTSHWGESGIHYRWSEGGIEGTAFVIKALSQINPQSPYLDQAVKWMSLNRRGARWKNTRDTAISILGLSDYLKTTQELAPEFTYDIVLNGKSVRQGNVNSSNVLSFSRFVDIPADQLRDGNNTIKVIMKGKGSLYISTHTKYFTLEEPITKAGNEIFVTRKYYKQSVKETLMKGYTNDWKPLKEGDSVESGDRVRVDITMEAKNHYEYLVTEDYKPAGFEAVELNSGPGHAITLDYEGRETTERVPLYQEFRDQKAAFFISKLKQGKHLIRYELRAETPGTFHAMPNQAHAMYVPEIRANSDEATFTVTDKKETPKE